MNDLRRSPPPLLSPRRARLLQRIELIAVTLAALAVRLEWNLKVHRILDYVYSDMDGYLGRAQQLFFFPQDERAYLAFFPYGTHVFIYAVKRLFGPDNAAALDAAYAVAGSIAVAYTYALAGRYIKRRWARWIVGVVLVGYYPWISLGGYALSEIPFAACLSGVAFHTLRLADLGKKRDAWLAGLFFALGLTLRPQILLGAVFLGLHVIFRRRAWRRVTPALVLGVALPLTVAVGFSAYRLHRYTGTWGLVSTNGPLNYLFGRCHNVRLFAANGGYGPMSFDRLRLREEAGIHSHIKLNPVLGEKIQIDGILWDPVVLNKVSSECVALGGYMRQVEFALGHVMLLWAYNVPWPDQMEWRFLRFMQLAWRADNILFLAPASAAIFLAFARKRARSMILALHLWSVVIAAMLYFGEARFRVPYDGLMIVMAMQSYVELLQLLKRLLTSGVLPLWGRARNA